jgi:hypothetical protein
VSEQQAEQTSGETGSLSAGPSDSQSPAVQSEQVTASAPEMSVVDSPQIAPDHEAPKADEPKVEAPKVEATKVEAPKVEATKVEATKVEATKVEAPKPDAPRTGKLMIMAPGERTWSSARASEPKAEQSKAEQSKAEQSKAGQPKPEQGAGMFGKRRFAAVAAVVALATVAGALGGALATAGLGHLIGAAEATAPANGAIEASIARIDADILALKADVEHTSKMSIGQVNKTSDRLDKIEKAQAEPIAKLARLTEAVDKLRAAPAAMAAVPVAPKEVTGSVAPPPAAAAAPKVEVGKLPTVEGWVLTDVGYGGALIENRRRSYEVYAGDNVPGLGRIDAIRKQDGRWVVVTSKGLITSR